MFNSFSSEDEGVRQFCASHSFQINVCILFNDGLTLVAKHAL
jgi:hypothetical protein